MPWTPMTGQYAKPGQYEAWIDDPDAAVILGLLRASPEKSRGGSLVVRKIQGPISPPVGFKETGSAYLAKEFVGRDGKTRQRVRFYFDKERDPHDPGPESNPVSG